MEKEVIRVWFCNRRQKEKRINPCSAAPMLPSPGKPASYSPHLVPRAPRGEEGVSKLWHTLTPWLAPCVKHNLPGCPQCSQNGWRQGEPPLGTGCHTAHTALLEIQAPPAHAGMATHTTVPRCSHTGTTQGRDPPSRRLTTTQTLAGASVQPCLCTGHPFLPPRVEGVTLQRGARGPEDVKEGGTL